MHLSAVCKLIFFLSLSTLLINVCDGTRWTRTRRPGTTKKAAKVQKLDVCSNAKFKIPKMRPRSLITMSNESLSSAPRDGEMNETRANDSFAHQEDSNFKIESRMWKGKKISVSEVPFLANVMEDGEGIVERVCNAAFITSRVAVTAAHCFFDSEHRRIDDNRFFLRYNTDDLRSKPGDDGDIEKVIVHRKFVCTKVHSAYDIALVVLKSPFKGWTPDKVIKLPKQAEKKKYINNKHPLAIVSTGPTFPRSSRQYILKKQITFLYTDECVKLFEEYFYRSPAFDRKRMLCNRKEDNLVDLGGTVYICTHKR